MMPCRLDPDFECDGCENQAVPCCAGKEDQAEETPIGEALDQGTETEWDDPFCDGDPDTEDAEADMQERDFDRGY